MTGITSRRPSIHVLPKGSGIFDQQYIDVKNKTITVTNMPIKGKVGDYIDTGHPFYPIARIVGIKGNVISLDNIIDGLKSGKMHVGINGLK